MIRDTIAVILGGGQGERLYPLTKDRAKPAVPIAGKFRLVDIPKLPGKRNHCREDKTECDNI